MLNVEEILFLIGGYEEVYMAVSAVSVLLINYKIRDFKIWRNRQDNLWYICRVLDFEKEHQIGKGVFYQNGNIIDKNKDNTIAIEKLKRKKQLKYMKKLMKMADKEVKRYDKIATVVLKELNK